MTEGVKYCVDCEKVDACEARFLRAVLEIRDMLREIRDSIGNTRGQQASAVPVGAIEVCIGRTAHFEDDDGSNHL